MDQTYTVGGIKTALDPIFAEYGVRKAILFGSYAKGYATPQSDVDILVDSGLRGLRFFGLLERINTTLGIPVDLLDVQQIEKDSQIEREILTSGVPIYEQ